MTALDKNKTLGIESVALGSFLIGNFGEGVAQVPPNSLNKALLAARQPDLVIVTSPGVQQFPADSGTASSYQKGYQLMKIIILSTRGNAPKGGLLTRILATLTLTLLQTT